MADISGYYLPKFFNDSQDDPLMYDADLGILAVVNNMPEGFISTTQVPDEIYICWGGAGLYKWNGVSWSTISIGTSQSTGAPVIPATVDYFAGSVTVTEAASNVMYFSGLLADTTWDPVNLSVQLDQFLQDSITGMSAWQGFNLIEFKNTSV